MAGYSAKRLVRQAIVNTLADPRFGWTAVHQAIAQDFVIQPITFDFGPDSKNVLQSNIQTREGVYLTGIFAPPVMVVYTDKSMDQQKSKPTTFSGGVLANVDVYLGVRLAKDQDQFGPADLRATEQQADAVEDTIRTVFGRKGFPLPSGVSFGGYIDCETPEIQIFGDGYEQVIQFKFPFEVTL